MLTTMVLVKIVKQKICKEMEWNEEKQKILFKYYEN